MQQSAMETNCQPNGSNDDVSNSYVGYAQAAYVSGWMYVSEQGQYCGPYIQEQLYDGLSTSYLPEHLHVYPILNGNLGNPVPLKYFRQFPDHVATGFVYLTASASSFKDGSDKSPRGVMDSKKEEMRTDAVSTSTQQIPISEASNSTSSFPSMVLLQKNIETFLML